MEPSTSIQIKRNASAFKADDEHASFTLLSSGKDWGTVAITMYGTHVLVTIASSSEGMRDSILAFLPLDEAKTLRYELDAAISELEGASQ